MGELLTAAKLNTDLRDGLSFLLAPPLAILTRTALQTINNNTVVALPWDTELVDRDGGHSTSTSTARYAAQTAGYYTLHAYISWGLASTAGYRRLMFRTNGTTFVHQDARTSTTAVPASHLSGLLFLAANEYVELLLDQNSGSAIDIGVGARWDIVWTST